MSLRELRDKVAAGTFLMDVLPPHHELTAYNAFSGSLDAAKVLHEALLPGWGAVVGMFGWATLTDTNSPGNSLLIETRIPGNPARAWLLAILNALIQGEDD